MFSVFKQRNLQIPTHSPIRIGFDDWILKFISDLSWIVNQFILWSIRIVCDPTLQREAAIISDGMPSYACEIYEQISSSEAFFCRPVSSWIPSAIHSFRTPSLNGLFKDTSSDWRREVRVWRKCSQYLSCELQMSRKQASSFSSPGHRSAHFYFLCCLFNVCKLGRAWQTIESVNNTHRDFDAYFYRKKVRIIHG